MDEIDQAIAELSLKYPDLKQQVAKPSQPTISSLLAVSLAHLDSQAELRKFFGSKVVQSQKASKRQPVVHRSNLTRPRPEWAYATHREGLSIRLLDDHPVYQPDEQWWTIEYSKKYKSITKSFITIVQSGDPQGFRLLLAKAPWHADTLLQLSEVFRHREEHAEAIDAIDRALFTYERAFIGAFNFTSGCHRLDFDYVENRPFFLAVHRQVVDLQRRGCFRTAFEFCRLLYGLDPWSDPHGALLHLDYLSIKSGMSSWLIDLFSFFQTHNSTTTNPTLLPGILYSRALALRLTKSPDADNALAEAIRSYPSIVPLLCNKLDLLLPPHLLSHKDFRISADRTGLAPGESIVHLLSHLYVQRTFNLWKDHATWLQSTLPSSWAGKIRKPWSPEALTTTIHRHLIITSPPQSLLSFLPEGTTSISIMSFDPLPPLTCKTSYSADYFASVPSFLSSSARSPEERELERMVPNPHVRHYLRALFNAHAGLVARFGGDLRGFVRELALMDRNDVEGYLMGLGQEAGLVQQEGAGEMPGGLGDDIGIDEDGDQHGAADEPVREVSGEEEDDESDEDDEPVPTLPVRLLRGVLGMFWGSASGPTTQEDESDSDVD